MKFDRNKEFKKDLKWGKFGEGVIINFIEEHFKNKESFVSYWYSSDDIYKSKSKLKLWDLRFGCYKYKDRINFYDKFEVEIKTDGYEKNTGNLIFEKSSNKKKSGVFDTQAKYFIYFLPLFKENNIYVIKSERLKELLKTFNEHIVEGGDYGSKTFMYKIPTQEFQDEFKKYSGRIYSWNKYDIPETFKKVQFNNKITTYYGDELKQYKDPFDFS